MRLLRAFIERASRRFEIVLFVNELVEREYRPLLAEFETRLAPISGANKLLRVAAEHTWLASAAGRAGLDLIHHMGGTHPLVGSVPGVVTIHDLQPLAMPSHFTPVKRWYLRAILPRSVERARRVITLTNFTRNDLVERLGVSGENIDIVPSGIRLPDSARESAHLDSVLDRYGLERGRYFLYPAITYMHKNHLVLVDALRGLPPRHDDIALVLTGGESQQEHLIAERARDLGLAERLVRTGRIQREDLDALYWGARALLFPSRFEGFGLPVLEAMVRNCPVLAADATALPEVVGGAGLLIDPRDATAWTKAMIEILDDDALRSRLIEAGRDRATRYSWSDAAESLENSYAAAMMAES